MSISQVLYTTFVLQDNFSNIFNIMSKNKYGQIELKQAPTVITYFMNILRTQTYYFNANIHSSSGYQLSEKSLNKLELLISRQFVFHSRHNILQTSHTEQH